MHQEEFFENNYSKKSIDEALDADEISAEEEGFLQGYEEAASELKRKSKKQE